MALNLIQQNAYRGNSTIKECILSDMGMRETNKINTGIQTRIHNVDLLESNINYSIEESTFIKQAAIRHTQFDEDLAVNALFTEWNGISERRLVDILLDPRMCFQCSLNQTFHCVSVSCHLKWISKVCEHC